MEQIIVFYANYTIYVTPIPLHGRIQLTQNQYYNMEISDIENLIREKSIADGYIVVTHFSEEICNTSE